jgi:mycothiol system anti-sigma-R factor
MSCGNHHETDCSEVLAEVWLFLDHECDEERRRLLAKHLDECEPCLSEYGLDEKLKRLLASKCGGEHAPVELKNRLRQQIRVAVLEQAEVVVEAGPEGTTATVEMRGARIEQRG